MYDSHSECVWLPQKFLPERCAPSDLRLHVRMKFAQLCSKNCVARRLPLWIFGRVWLNKLRLSALHDFCPGDAREIDPVELTVNRFDSRFAAIRSPNRDRSMAANLVERFVRDARVVALGFEGMPQRIERQSAILRDPPINDPVHLLAGFLRPLADRI